LAEQIGTKFWLAWQKTALAACLLMLGNSETGRRLCEEAIRVCEETSDKYVLAFAHRSLAEIVGFLKPLNAQRAENSMLKAIRIQEEICAKPELARSFMSYARLLRGMGDKEKAEEFLDKAKGMFKHMGMAWDLVQATRVGKV
jgi:tetratricopeptide (TPR) repeat protein